MSKLKIGKAPGINRIKIDAFKGLNEDVLIIIAKLFELMYQQGAIPEIWKYNLITMLHKGGKKEN